MTDDDPWAGLRRWHRCEYLRQHEKQRRAGLKAEGARRIDITLRGKALDDYATVRLYVEGLNQLIAEREIKQPPIRLSDTEIIKMALSYAADGSLRKVGLIGSICGSAIPVTAARR
jgi:hypothetical protein